jgi:hypothetical protein
MNDTKLKLLVTEAVKLDRAIAEQTEKLKGIKAQLVTEAESRAELAVKTDGGGTSTTLEGEDGCVARVTVAGPTLKGSVEVEAKGFAKIKAAAGRMFDELFKPGVIYVPVDKFRERATLLLGTDAKPLIKLMVGKGKTSVAFETKEVAS